MSILRLDFRTAQQYNILSVPLFAGIFLYCIFAAMDFLGNKHYIETIEKQLGKWYMYLIYAAIMGLAWFYNMK